ncbi:hypothetical protein ID866_1185, partial [Astraeus odoratus]
MSSLFLLTFLTTIVLLCLCSPVVRRSVMAGDDTLDAHEAGIALVATRNPFRETGPPRATRKSVLFADAQHRCRLAHASAEVPQLYANHGTSHLINPRVLGPPGCGWVDLLEENNIIEFNLSHYLTTFFEIQLPS